MFVLEAEGRYAEAATLAAAGIDGPAPFLDTQYQFCVCVWMATVAGQPLPEGMLDRAAELVHRLLAWPGMHPARAHDLAVWEALVRGDTDAALRYAELMIRWMPDRIGVGYGHLVTALIRRIRGDRREADVALRRGRRILPRYGLVHLAEHGPEESGTVPTVVRPA